MKYREPERYKYTVNKQQRTLIIYDNYDKSNPAEVQEHMERVYQDSYGNENNLSS